MDDRQRQRPADPGRPPASVGTTRDEGVPWWREAVVYQIYPRSFADGNGDGVGDLHGAIGALDHLAWLGVDAVWLSPIYRSPMADFGYDVSDHTDVDPTFGDLEAFDRFLRGAHERGIRVLLDWVPNHTSDQHPWFVSSRSSRSSPHRDWYIWRDGRDGGPPNNWPAAFGGPAWTRDEETGQWYLHLFLPEQPDLNWSNPQVERAMHDVLRFWLDRGVDGFRADVVHLIGKDPGLPDQPPEVADVDLVAVYDHPSTHRLLKRIRAVLDEYDDRMMVGEVNLRSAELLRPYYGQGDQLDLVFNFFAMRERWSAPTWRSAVRSVLDTLTPSDAWPTWVLSNHDVPRHRTRHGGGLARARAAAVLLLTLPGTPFLYAGEELGLVDADVPEDRRVDPDGRDGCRAPIPWETTPPHGWHAAPWLPFPPGAAELSVEAQRRDAGSILHLYRRLLRVRRACPALRRGTLDRLDASDQVLAFSRSAADRSRLVLVNFSSQPAPAPAGRGRPVELSSDRHRETGAPFDGRLRGDEAVILLADGAGHPGPPPSSVRTGGRRQGPNPGR